ncbi:MAG TPA: DUF1553 domain-containing protein [Acidobacteriota bacterium]
MLRGAGATQQLLLESRAGGVFNGDLTARAAFSSSNPVVAKVNERGLVTAVSDGRSIISAKIGDQLTSTVITVEQSFAPYPISFRNHVLPVMTKAGCNSGACHGAASGKNGFRLTLRGYDPEVDYLTLSRQASARRINKIEPAMSLMLLKPTLAVSHAGGMRFAPGSDDYKTISKWIASGMPAPSDTDPAITRLEVFPKQVRLFAGQPQQILVRASFSDGHVEDVTRWTKFFSSDENVAVVDDKGIVKLQGAGEAAVSVWYLSRVSAARVFSPFANTISAEAYQSAPRSNYIDDLIIQKLQELAIEPSRLASDSEFIRRAYLDAAGILPTAEEVQRFLADNAAEKRTRLIDSLLERPEYVDYWSYRLSDMFLVNSQKLPSNAMWSYYNWVRSGVAENKPLSKMARELITASGNTLSNGAANYYVLHKDPIDITENMSIAFMGFSITCARCHNHPLEKWTQKDYYQMANLFSRVALKNGAGRGDVIVYSSDAGDINHPRLNEPLAPRPLEGPALKIDSAVDRREHFALWLTSSENPFFGRAMVNRIWKNFMGRGLVEAVDDIRDTNPPTHAELLEKLTRDFIDHNFELKHLIRTIMNSSTYQLTSVPNNTNKGDLKYYSHYIARRLPAEVILDALSQAAGVPEKFKGHPPGRRALQLPDTQVESYFLDIFGRPPRIVAVDSERQQEPTVTQALHVINGDTINRKLRSREGFVQKLMDSNPDNRAAIEQVYLRSLSRRATTGEVQALSEALDRNYKQLLEMLGARKTPGSGSASGYMAEADTKEKSEAVSEEEESIAASVKKPAVASKHAAPRTDEKPESLARRQVLEDLMWAVLTGKEFLFNH